MNERNLQDGQWEDRRQWNLGVGQRGRTFWNRLIYIYIYIYVNKCNGRYGVLWEAHRTAFFSAAASHGETVYPTTRATTCNVWRRSLGFGSRNAATLAMGRGRCAWRNSPTRPLSFPKLLHVNIISRRVGTTCNGRPRDCAFRTDATTCSAAGRCDPWSLSTCWPSIAASYS
jgi:hypothetical protein